MAPEARRLAPERDVRARDGGAGADLAELRVLSRVKGQAQRGQVVVQLAGGARADAGVAIGTLYRHFPARDDLTLAVFDGQLDRVARTGEQALTDPDPWAGFTRFVETLCALAAEDLGFNELTSIDRPARGGAAAVRSNIHQLWQRLLTRAQEAGVLRPDLVLGDMFVLLWSQSRIIEATYGVAPRAWRRHLYLMLDAYRAEGARPLPEPPLTGAQMEQATARLNRVP